MAQAVAKPAAKKARKKTAKKAPTKRIRSGATRKTAAEKRRMDRALSPDEIIIPGAENAPIKRNPGQLAHIPTEEDRDEVKQMVKIGCTQDNIAVIKRIDVRTLRKHYAEELAVGAAEGHERLRHAQFDEAVNNRNASLLIWLGKQMLGQTDKVEGSGMGDIVQYKVAVNFVGAK